MRLGSFSGPTDGAATAAEAMKLAAKGTQTETIDERREDRRRQLSGRRG